MEQSFVSPKKRPQDLVSQMRSHRHHPSRTPSARNPLTSRPQGPANKKQSYNTATVRRSGEFTPLLQSVTKKNAFGKGKENAAPDTPAFLRKGYIGQASPALTTGGLGSSVYGSEGPSMLEEDVTDLPKITSSEQSTPIAPRQGEGVLDGETNAMNLREQTEVCLHALFSSRNGC